MRTLLGTLVLSLCLILSSCSQSEAANDDGWQAIGRDTYAKTVSIGGVACNVVVRERSGNTIAMSCNWGDQ